MNYFMISNRFNNIKCWQMLDILFTKYTCIHWPYNNIFLKQYEKLIS